MPVVHPADLWQRDRPLRPDRPRDGALQGPSRARHGAGDDPRGGRRRPAARHRAAATGSCRSIVYHFQTKFRDEPRARGGLIRVREFAMKDSYSSTPTRPGWTPRTRLHHGLRAHLRAAGPGAIAVGADVGMMGGSAGARVHGPQRARRGHARHLRRLRLRRQPADRAGRQARAAGRGAAAHRGGRHARDRHDRRAGGVARHPRRAHRQGRVLRGRRRPAGDRHRARRLRRQRDEAGATRSRRRGAAPGARGGDPAAGMEPGYGSPIGAHDTVVVVDDLAARVSEPGGGREPARLPPAQRQRRPRLHARRGGRHHQRPGRRRLPDLRLAGASCASGIEVGNIFKLGTDLHRGARRDFLAEDGEPPPGRDGLVRHRAGPRVACVVEAHHDDKGIAWPIEVAPYRAHLVAIGAVATTGASAMRPRLSTGGWSRPACRSCTTTATSRRA